MTTDLVTDEQLAKIRADMADAQRCEHELRTQPSMTTVRGLVAGSDLLLRALREARAENERLREFASWVAHLDESDGEAERRTVTLGLITYNARAALAAPTGQEEE